MTGCVAALRPVLRAPDRRGYRHFQDRHPGEFPARPGRKPGIVVHDQQHLPWPRALVQRRLQRRAGKCPPLFGVRADHDAHTLIISNGDHPRKGSRVPGFPDGMPGVLACRVPPGWRPGGTGDSAVARPRLTVRSARRRARRLAQATI